MALDRSQAQANVPALPKETVPFAPLRGEVIVRGLLLAEQQANGRRTAQEREPREGETVEEALTRANAVMAVRIVSQAVIDADGAPLLTLKEWEAVAASDQAALFGLADIALKLSGSRAAELEKN